jgi:hypothetical protein
VTILVVLLKATGLSASAMIRLYPWSVVGSGILVFLPVVGARVDALSGT